MNRIEKLIEELCPDGVEFKELGGVSKINTGNSNANESEIDGEFPFFVRSKNIKYKNTFEFDEEVIIIPGEGGVGDIFHYYKGKFSLHQRAYKINILLEEVNPKFIYYYLVSNFKKYILVNAVDATVLSIRKPMIEKFKIPIPPLQIQEEIVKILDKFTQLEAELEAELEARKLQYEYYLNKLLTVNPEIELNSLGETCDIKRGRFSPRPRNNPIYYGGKIPFVQTGDISRAKTYVHSFSQTLNDKGLSVSKLFPKGTILMTIAANIGDIAILSFDAACPDSLVAFIPNKNINNKWLYYILGTLKHKFLSISDGSAQKNLSLEKIKPISISIPPLINQEKIVNVLDQFDTLVNDITIGLPAEIAARRQQYEYYRNQLLTFKPYESK